MLMRISNRIVLFVLVSLSVPILSTVGKGLSASEDSFLEAIQTGVASYFWDECGTNGLVRDRLSDLRLSSTLAGGLQLTAYCVEAERGWRARETAAARVLQVLRGYAALPRFHGMFARYYDLETRKMVPEVPGQAVSADVTETAYLMAGALTCAEYFDAKTPLELNIRKLAKKLYLAVEWNWMLGGAQERQQWTLARSWSPTGGFSAERLKSDFDLSAMLAYLLAIGSPTHSIPVACWNSGWALSYTWWDGDDARFISCPPLAAHQYAHIWVNFRNCKDRFADYFRNSVYATYANRDYGITQLYPVEGLWGLTYCDGPDGFALYGYPPLSGPVDQDAVISPAAAGGSIVFTPRESIQMLYNIYDRFGEKIFGKYGFVDACSPKNDWFSTDVVAVDSGPLMLMIENYRSELIWRTFMKNQFIRRAMDRVGFVGVIDDFEPHPGVAPYNLWESSRRYAQRTVDDSVREGVASLKVSFVRRAHGQDAPLIAKPIRSDFSRYRYISLWLKGLDRLHVSIEDSSHRSAQLRVAGSVPSADGWAHIYYELPQSSMVDLATVNSVMFAVPTSVTDAGEFYMDGIFLVNEADLTNPHQPDGFRADTTRMPGEVLLAWDASANNSQMPFKYNVRYSRRPIRDEQEFQRATPVSGDMRIPGTATGCHLTGLTVGQTYYFSIKTEDINGQRSSFMPGISLTLPRQDVADRFSVASFDGGDIAAEQARWSSDSSAVIPEVTEDHALQGLRCLKLTCQKNGAQDAYTCVSVDLDFRDFSHHKFLTLWVYGEAAVLPKLWGGDHQQQELSLQTSKLADGWSPLYFDLSELKQVDPSDISKLMFYIAPGETNFSRTIYIDTIELKKNRM